MIKIKIAFAALIAIFLTCCYNNSTQQADSNDSLDTIKTTQSTQPCTIQITHQP